MEILDDKPQGAAPAIPEERKAILDTLSKYVTPDRVLSIDVEKWRGTMEKPKSDSDIRDS